MEHNIGLILAKRASLNPHLEAIVDLTIGLRLNFQELDQRANQAANMMTQLGVQKGDRVGLLIMNSVEFVETFFGLAKIGAVIVPLNWRLVADELEYILKNSGTKLLVFGSEFVDTVVELHNRGDKTEIQTWLQIDSNNKVQDFTQNYTILREEASTDQPAIDAGEDDLLYIMYTSGTTGLPKGVVHTHSTVLWAIISLNATADGRSKDRYLGILPLFHVGALLPLTWCVYVGANYLLMKSFDPVASWQAIQNEKITTMLAVPAMLNFMRQVPNLEQYKHPDLRWCICGAAPVPVPLIEAYAAMNIEIHQVYGLTESGGPACLISSDDALRKAGSTGKAYFHTEVRIVDKSGKELSLGEIGEIQVKGKHLMTEYWNNPEATQKTLQGDWLNTGDVAVMDEEGFVYIKDRVKDMIISGGENVYPAEIENVIAAHPNVVEVAVIGKPDPKWGESPLALVVRKDESLTEEGVLEHCYGKLAKFKQPQGAIFIEEIPRNPTGKALKRILREKYL